MTINSSSEVRELETKAEEGSLSENEFHRLLDHLQDDPDLYVDQTISAVAKAVRTGPEQYFDDAKPLLYNLMLATTETESSGVETITSTIANQVSLLAKKSPKIIDEEYRSTVEELNTSDRLQPSILSVVLSGPIVSETDETYLTHDLLCSYFDTCQRVLETVPYDELPPYLGMILAAFDSFLGETDDEQVVDEAVDRIDLLLLLGYSEAPIRTLTLALFEQLAELNPESLELFVGSLITRLDETTNPADHRSDTPIQNMEARDSRHISPSHRRAIACRSLKHLVDAHPDRCEPATTRIQRLLEDEDPEVRLSALGLAVRLYVVDVEGAVVPSDHKETIHEIIKTTSNQRGWFRAVTTSASELLTSNQKSDHKLASAMSQTLTEEYEEALSDLPDELKILSVMALAEELPTPPVIEDLLDTEEELPDIIEQALAESICTTPEARNLSESPPEQLREIIEYAGPDLVADDTIEAESIRKTVDDFEYEMSSEFEEALISAEQN
ncbi:hypothetical protein SAMN05216226_1234 [Halovenus aranensis]|uniref:Uncharacterized protein n=1 Tax=Halovenus aranensis TaxID=890420 RepID=A0A1G8ZH40_9EURY|nr:hypothetical protein [Halovenus aranensis]SDK13904.1 hypothetical protein SAMN05216226_1234 [Halovenus aranensis]